MPALIKNSFLLSFIPSTGLGGACISANSQSIHRVIGIVRGASAVSWVGVVFINHSLITTEIFW